MRRGLPAGGVGDHQQALVLAFGFACLWMFETGYKLKT